MFDAFQQEGKRKQLNLNVESYTLCCTLNRRNKTIDGIFYLKIFDIDFPEGPNYDAEGTVVKTNVLFGITLDGVKFNFNTEHDARSPKFYEILISDHKYVIECLFYGKIKL